MQKYKKNQEVSISTKINKLVSTSNLRLTIHFMTAAYFFYMPIEIVFVGYSILMFFVIGRIGADLGFHRFFAHQSFQAHPTISKILLILGTISLRGSLLSWITVHKEHHELADTDGDPHPGLNSSVFNLWFANIKPNVKFFNRQINYFQNSWVIFLHRNYNFMILLFVASIGLIWGLRVLVYFYCLPVIYLSLSSLLTSTICHRWGYRNFETNDKSTNNLAVQIVTLGGGLHNNHHANPSRLSQKIRWFEFDFLAPILSALKFFKLIW